MQTAAQTNAESAAENADHNAPLRQYLRAYESMNMAEWLKSQELHEEAGDIFRETLELFKQLAQSHPDWQGELVQFRIAHCEKELAALRGETTSAPQQTVPASMPASRPTQAPALESARNTARLRRAMQLEKIMDLTAALTIYNEILDDAPAYLPALRGAARIHFRMNRTDQARAMLETAAQLPENDEATLLLRAMLLCHDGDFVQARRLLETILTRNPWNPHAHLCMGAALSATDQFAAAEESTKRAISLSPKLGDAYYNLARISLRHQPVNLDVTRNHYRNALKYGAFPDPEMEALIE